MAEQATPRAQRSSAAHRHPELAQSFGAQAQRYDRVRPRYPSALVDAIVDRLPGPAVVDVGIGTGISAEPFRDRGCVVLGLEPDPAMAELARTKGFDVEITRVEDWDPAGRAFDGMIAGQAWHWVDPAAGAAVAASALRPGGRLAVFWNVGRPPEALTARFAAVFDDLGTGLPFNPWATAGDGDPYGAILAAAGDALRATGAFGELERLTFHRRSSVTRDAWLEQTSTAGGLNRLPPPTLAALLHGLGVAIDEAGGRLSVEWTTVAAVAERRPGRG